jgi:phosphoribosylamine--glycine ligase
MNILVIGNGGREHAIVWKLSQSKPEKIFCAPGNAGINLIAETVDIKADDLQGLLRFAKENQIDLTVTGPEIPLSLGITDLFKSEGLRIFGPSRKAAMLESSKVFAKNFMMKYGIPTAKFGVFRVNEKIDALNFLDKSVFPLVIKADGLAAGKGVVICEDRNIAERTLKEFFEKKIFGSAGEQAVIEEFLTGREASVFAICDSTDYVLLPPAQDHKKILDGEKGKNTGGMGSYAPADKVVTSDVLEKVKSRIVEPVLKHMKEEGNEFKGCLYCGLMIDENNDPQVIEFNVRFGDPETQVVLPLIKSDFLELLFASAGGNISDYVIETGSGYYCSVVLASSGYPDSYETGKEITGLDKVKQNCLVFHAGTRTENGRLLSNGGRVLNIVGFSESSLKEAIQTAYENAELINFDNKYYRKDIGVKGV